MPYCIWEDNSYCSIVDIDSFMVEHNKTDNFDLVYYESEEELLDNYMIDMDNM